MGWSRKQNRGRYGKRDREREATTFARMRSLSPMLSGNLVFGFIEIVAFTRSRSNNIFPSSLSRGSNRWNRDPLVFRFEITTSTTP